jgi:hypothetical protein
MKSRLAVVLPIVLLVVALSALIVSAGASTQPYTGSLAYQNPNGALANVVVSFYAQNSGTIVTSVPITVPAHGSGTLSFGGISALGSSFAGSAVLSADQFMSTDVIESSSTAGYDRGAYAGTSSDAASTTVYVPLISQNKFDQLTTLSVQNADSGPVDIVVKYIFRDTGGVSLTYPINALPVGSAKYLKSDTVGLPAGFTGSAVVTATGKIVASANNPYVSAKKFVAFEGIGAGSNLVYLPSAQCNLNSVKQTTYFAIQNTSLAATTHVTVTYYNLAGSQSGIHANQAILPGQKFNTDPCTDSQGNGYSGSAKITTANGEPAVVALVNTGAALSANFATAYDGINAGSQNSAFAYISWGTAATEWDTFVACQNVGTNPLTATVKYYDYSGVQKGSTQTFPNVNLGSKFNTNASAAGALTSSKFSGAIEISADSGNLLGCVVQGVSISGGNAIAYVAVPLP